MSDARTNQEYREPKGAVKRLMLVASAVLTMSLMLSGARGVFAADDTVLTAESTNSPVNLAGRWTGQRHGYGGPRTKSAESNADKTELTFDIVKCGGDWCGIRVTTETPCGAIAIKMSEGRQAGHRQPFDGKLELAKGAEPYVIQAWFSPAGSRAGEGSNKPHLNILGDTGGEFLIMRRSFPFQAELARTGDAQCTLEKATS